MTNHFYQWNPSGQMKKELGRKSLLGLIQCLNSGLHSLVQINPDGVQYYCENCGSVIYDFISYIEK